MLSAEVTRAQSKRRSRVCGAGSGGALARGQPWPRGCACTSVKVPLRQHCLPSGSVLSLGASLRSWGFQRILLPRARYWAGLSSVWRLPQGLSLCERGPGDEPFCSASPVHMGAGRETSVLELALDGGVSRWDWVSCRVSLALALEKMHPWLGCSTMRCCTKSITVFFPCAPLLPPGSSGHAASSRHEQSSARSTLTGRDWVTLAAPGANNLCTGMDPGSV